MGSLFAELKRRHIYRVAAAYAVVAWVLVQVVNNLAPIFDLPAAFARAVVLLLIVGFPVTLLIAWMRELPAADSPTTRASTSRLDWALLGALVVVIALVSYQQLATTGDAGTAQQAGATSGARQAPVSIAVLPFINLSDDRAQEFFSDGMTEEITSALAKVQTLRVVGRTSAFEYKGQNRDLRAIGQALSATHLIEGSVRKDGNQVRITAQLIKADDGTHLWTESYDRELKGVFAVQEDIAQAIAASLRVPLGLQQGDTLVRHRIEDSAVYDQYLRARALLRAPTFTSVTEAAKLLEDVVAHDQNFAPAWAELSLAYTFSTVFHPAIFSDAVDQARPVIEAGVPKAEAAAQRAAQLDPKSSDGYMALGFIRALHGKYIEAADLQARALALDADNPEALELYGDLLADLGYLKQALPIRQHLLTIEPFAPLFTRITATIMWVSSGQTDEPIALLKRVPEGFAANRLAQIYGAQGRYSEAADLLMSRADSYLPGVAESAARLLRSAPTATASPETLPHLGQYMGFVYLTVGAPSRVLDVNEDSIKLNFQVPTTNFLLWSRPYEVVRKTERFKSYIRNAGMVEYWRAKGWPDLCHPTTGDDFACD